MAETNKAKIEVTAEYDEKSGPKVSAKVEEHFKKLYGRLDELNKRRDQIKTQRGRTAKNTNEFLLLNTSLEELEKDRHRVARELIRSQKKFDDQVDPESPQNKGRKGRRGGGFMGAVGSYGPQVLGAFSPLPGSQFAGGALRGAQQSYWNEIYRADAQGRDPHTGRSLLKGGAIGLGLGALGAGVLGAVIGSRRDEQVGLSMGRVFGGRGAGASVIGAGARHGFLAEEAAALAGTHARATGSKAGLGASMWAEQAYGLGGAASGLLGAVAKTGTPLTDARSKDALQRIFAAGTEQGLKQGRFGELLEGVSGIVQHSQFGVDETGLDRIAQMLRGMGPGLQGAAGASALSQLDQAVKGGGGPLSRSIAMQIAGLGDPSQGYYTTLRKMDQGMFGSGVGGLRGDRDAGAKFFGRFKSLYPGEEGTEGAEMRYRMISNQTGMSAELVARLERALTKGGKGDWEAAVASTKTSQEKAFDAMIEMGAGWREFQRAVQRAESTLGKLLDASGFLGRMTTALEWIAGALEHIPAIKAGMYPSSPEARATSARVTELAKVEQMFRETPGTENMDLVQAIRQKIRAEEAADKLKRQGYSDILPAPLAQKDQEKLDAFMSPENLKQFANADAKGRFQIMVTVEMTGRTADPAAKNKQNQRASQPPFAKKR